MNRHVFPQALLALLLGGLLAAAGWAQEGGESRPAGETPTKGADETGSAAGGEETEVEAPPKPPAVGEAFPAGLPIAALPRPGAVRTAPPAAPAGGSADGRAENAENAENAGGDGDGHGDGAAAAVAPPEVTLASLVGDTPRPLILIFWSSRCVVCKRYGDVLGKLSAALGERVALVLIASGADETPEAVRAALDAANLHVPVYLDTEKAAATALGVRVTPTAFLIDAEGVLRYRGPIDDDRRARSRDAREILRPAAESVLAGKTLESGDVRPFGSALR